MFGWLREKLFGMSERDRVTADLAARRLEMLGRLADFASHRNRVESDRIGREERDEACHGGLGPYGLGPNGESIPLPASAVDLLKKQAALRGQEVDGVPMMHVGRRDGKPLTDAERAKLLGEVEEELKQKLEAAQEEGAKIKAMNVKGVVFALSRELWTLQMHRYLSGLVERAEDSADVAADAEGLGEDEVLEVELPEMDIDMVTWMARNSLRAANVYFQMFDEMEVRVGDDSDYS